MKSIDNLLEQIFVTEKVAILAAEKGFNLPCLAVYPTKDIDTLNVKFIKGVLTPIPQQMSDENGFPVTLSACKFKDDYLDEYAGSAVNAPTWDQLDIWMEVTHGIKVRERSTTLPVDLYVPYVINKRAMIWERKPEENSREKAFLIALNNIK